MAFSPETRTKIRLAESEARVEKEEIRARFAETAEERAAKRSEIGDVNEILRSRIDAFKEEDMKAYDEKNKDVKDKSGFTSDSIRETSATLLTKYFTFDGELTLRHWRNNWWLWEDGLWALQTNQRISDEILHRLSSPDPSGLAIQILPRDTLERFIAYLRHKTRLDPDIDFQSWLPCQSEESSTLDLDTSGTWVNTRDFVRRADTKDPIKIPSTPRYWTPCRIPREPDNSPPTEWINFLGEVLEGDEKCYMLLQEWFGYCLLPSTRFQKLLMLIGPGGNGKSVVLNVLCHMLGTQNVSNAPLSALTEKHGSYVTFGKLLNSYDDISAKYLSDTGPLKAYTGTGSIVFEKKFCDPFSAKPTARLCFSMNELPRTDDDSDGFWRRLIIMPFRWFPEEENESLVDMEHPDCPWPDEMDQIFNWSLQGLSRLLKQGGFTGSKVCDQEKARWRKTYGNVSRYADERLTFNPEAEADDRHESLAVSMLAEDYRMWNKMSGEKAFATPSLIRRLCRLYVREGNLEEKSFMIGTSRVSYLVGLKIRRDAPRFGD